jgi:acetyl-CoA acetyltransferase
MASFPRGGRHPKAKLTDGAVARLRAEHAAGATLEALAQRYGLSPGHVRRIVTGKVRSHGQALTG